MERGRGYFFVLVFRVKQNENIIVLRDRMDQEIEYA